MAYDPTSRDFLPIKHVRALIARSATFKTWTDTVGDEPAALLRVYYEIVSDPADVAYPFAIVGLEEGSQTSEMTALSHNEIRGVVCARFLATVDPDDDLDEQLFVFADKVSVIKEEMVLDAVAYGFRMTTAPIPENAYLGSLEDRKSRGAYAHCKITIGYVDN